MLDPADGMTAMASGMDDAGMPDAARPCPTIRELLDAHFDFVWRSLRRMGVQAASVDDATQQVFWIASGKIEAILPGREKSFLFGIAVRVASDVRRAAQRGLEREQAMSHVRESELLAETPLADELLDRKRMRARLDQFLDGLSTEVRTAFVLYEAEGMTAPEIAEFVGVPIGTVASRIRLARKQFDAMVERLRSAEERGVGT